MAAYNIGQMEWDAAAAVDEAYVDEFRDNNVYTRFASPTGGSSQSAAATTARDQNHNSQAILSIDS